MILERGDMWSVFGKTDLFLITTNPIVKKNGACVMGAGIAKQAASRFPELPFDVGDRILQGSADGGYTNVDIVGVYDGQRVGYFMVKDHWAQPAKLSVIKQSVWDLLHSFTLDDKRVDINFPGIGNGKLKREDVLPLLAELPDHIHIWEF